MSQAPTARATVSLRDCRRSASRSRSSRHGLGCGATLALLLAATPAMAQQYGSVGSSVTVDYGVLDSLGGVPGSNLPGMLSNSYPQASPYGATAPYGGSPYAQQPYAASPYQAGGQLLAPPAAAPRSAMTTGQAGIAGDQVIKLIPPSQIKRTPPAAAAAPAPQQAAAPAPPPPPTKIEETPAAAPPSVPTPEPPAMAQTAPAAPAAPEPAPQAAAAPPPPPPPPAAEPAQEAAAATVPAAPPPPAPAAEPEEPELVPGGALDTAAPDDGEDMFPAVEAPAVDTPAPEQSLGEAGAAAEAEGDAGAADTQTAALPPQQAVEGQISIGFAEGASELTPEARSSLDEVAGRLRGDEAMRVQLLAYAQAIDDNTSRARRMSLSRALAVRAYLIEKGVRSTRMDVRALGSNVEGEPADRVDIIPQAQ